MVIKHNVSDTIVNGVKNPCALCGKPTKRLHEVTCQELGFVHGPDCKCYLIVGSDCYKKIKGKLKDGENL